MYIQIRTLYTNERALYTYKRALFSLLLIFFFAQDLPHHARHISHEGLADQLYMYSQKSPIYMQKSHVSTWHEWVMPLHEMASAKQGCYVAMTLPRTVAPAPGGNSEMSSRHSIYQIKWLFADFWECIDENTPLSSSSAAAVPVSGDDAGECVVCVCVYAFMCIYMYIYM